jgi:hypothetical protein
MAAPFLAGCAYHAAGVRTSAVDTSRVHRAIEFICAGLIVALAWARFQYFRPFLDEPHAFRQAWTSSYTLSMFHGDMNIFRPSIPSAGDFGHILIEFPIPEWITALLYHVVGPTLFVDRLVSLTFFAGSAYFLFRIAGLLHDRLFAWIATVIYLAAPLGIYYSRAVHIDSAALCAGHGLVFYFLRYGETGRRRHLLLALAASAAGMLVKAPYVFYLILPALYVQMAMGQRRRAVTSAAAFAAAVAVGVVWFAYAQSINRQAPDLSFVRGYEPAADRLDFYLGDLARRLNVDEWRTIFVRLGTEIGVVLWWTLVPIAFCLRRQLPRVWSATAIWTAGVVLFVVMFFAVNAIHNYYQLTLLAPFALWAAMPLYLAITTAGRWARARRSLAMATLAGYVVAGVVAAFYGYYRVDSSGIRVGQFVNQDTRERDLVIMAYSEAYNFDPRYLYYADRRGWSVYGPWLEPQAIEGLRRHGATVLVTSDRLPPPEETRRYLERYRLVDVFRIDNQHVFLHRLD